MFGASNLKSKLAITGNSVECPVKDCQTVVSRQRKKFQRSKDFFCQKHDIYISPSTFEYQNYTDNLLWKDATDLDLLKRISEVKRESRISRDNSEDAVTWNVFRFLEKENLLSKYMSTLSNKEEKDTEIVYWSYSQSKNGTLPELVEARKEFELKPQKGSEPDIIIKTQKTLFLIEAKLNASNNTVPSSKDTRVEKKYVSGGSGWYKQVFKSDFKTVARDCKKYELLRFWLLGSWMAKNQGLSFMLIDLVPTKREQDIETQFQKHIRQDLEKTFTRHTWEGIHKFIEETKSADVTKNHVLRYFENKTVGYNNRGKLMQAFSLR